jgi:hypothetical protein
MNFFSMHQLLKILIVEVQQYIVYVWSVLIRNVDSKNRILFVNIISIFLKYYSIE